MKSGNCWTDRVNAQSPAGGTPTAKALKQAYAYYTTGGGKDLSGSKWVMLVTDGGATDGGR